MYSYSELKRKTIRELLEIANEYGCGFNVEAEIQYHMKSELIDIVLETQDIAEMLMEFLETDSIIGE